MPTNQTYSSAQLAIPYSRPPWEEVRLNRVVVASVISESVRTLDPPTDA